MTIKFNKNSIQKGNNLNYEIFLNEFLTYFGKYHDFIHAISQTTYVENSFEICHNFKVYIIWLEGGPKWIIQKCLKWIAGK